MNIKNTRCTLFIISVLLPSCVLFPVVAHDIPVHQRITRNAADKSQKLTDFLRDNFNYHTGVAAPMFTYNSITLNPWGWIVRGSAREDDGARPKNHFYNPIDNSGLSDGSETGQVLQFTSPTDSFTWSSSRGGDGVVLKNQESWQNARDYLYAGLTGSSQNQRDRSLGHAFLALGQVVHLLEDLSQPSHTRNDNHFRKRYIEQYGLAHIDSLDYDAQPLDWAGAGFVRLRDFWDRGLHTGANANALDNDNGQNTLGLAEFSNGNFLSEDALYGELFFTPGPTFFGPGVLYFRYPSRDTGTDYNAVMTGLPGSTAVITLADGTSANRIILRKIAEGVNVEHHAALSFLGYKLATAGVQQGMGKLNVGISIFDDKVLADYHDILIPKAVSYSAGLIDYFFRGEIKLRLTWDEAQTRYKLSITNASAQKFKGGAFTLYSDDQNGNRSTVVLNMTNPWNSESTLEAGSSVETTFQAPSGTVAGYMLVYKGTIGTDAGGDTADSIDDGIAIAAHEFKILRFNIKWDLKSDIDLYLTDPDGAIISYSSRVSKLGELDIDNIGNTGPENITLKTVVDGEYQVWANYYRDHYIEDPNSEEDDPETAISVTMKTYFNSSTLLDTNTFTLTKPNYGADLPVGTSGPATQPSWYIRKQLKVENGKVTQH